MRITSPLAQTFAIAISKAVSATLVNVQAFHARVHGLLRHLSERLSTRYLIDDGHHTLKPGGFRVRIKQCANDQIDGLLFRYIRACEKT